MGEQRTVIGVRALGWALIAGFVLYSAVDLGILVSSLFKYWQLDLRSVEPSRYSPDLDSLLFTDEDSTTPFNSYHPTINHFGSRNAFEVTSEDQDLVILLGDSFFFGYGLPDEQTVSHYLNLYDPMHRYVNLALPGANIWDSVERFLSKRDQMGTPCGIVLQILLENDVCGSAELEERARVTVAKDHSRLLPPLDRLVNRNTLLRLHHRILWQRLRQDLTDARFSHYVREPLERLARSFRAADGTPIVVVSYSDTVLFSRYHQRLRGVCSELSIRLLLVEDLVTPSELADRLPDGHPSGGLNSAVARALVDHIPWSGLQLVSGE